MKTIFGDVRHADFKDSQLQDDLLAAEKKREATASREAKIFTYTMGWLLLLLAIATLAISGCGTGGYAGGSLFGLSSSAVTLDAGQSFPITANVTPGLAVTWTLSGTNCSVAPGCGSISNSAGPSLTYTAPQGLATQIMVSLEATVDGGKSAVTITVNPDPVINGDPPSGVVGQPYTATLKASGGTAPLTFTQSGGSLPAGLTFHPATGIISGTPTTQQTSTATFTVVDSSDVPYTVTAQEAIAVVAQPSEVINIGGNPPSGTVGAAYSTQLTAKGGVSPYTWSILSGALPPGLNLSATTGVISGSPTTVGTYVFSVQVQDSTGTRATASFGINITAAGTPLSLSMSTLPNGAVGVPYSATIGVSGGTSPYNCTITSGMLPAGLALGASCLVSGTPTTAGTVTVQVQATDSSSPQQSVNGPETITITAASLSLTTGTLPDGTVGAPYSATIGVSGGTAPYSCTITSGMLPAGLALGANCLVSGTPTTAGTVTVQVMATDSSSPQESTSGPETITILPASLSLTTGTLPSGMVGTPYSATIGVSGGTSPYSCTITSGTLPAGLTLGAKCLVSGTPTTAGTVTVQVHATDSSSPQQSTSGPETITINPAPLSLTTGTLPDGTVGTPYSETIGVSGGTSPYSCAIISGTLPAGLTLGAQCLVSGTPTTAGTVTVQVHATDSSSPQESTSGPETITINPATTTLILSSPPSATVNQPYTGVIPVSGGTGPYNCTLKSGTLPTGLSLGAHCTITGTPTAPGAVTVTVTATDSSNPVNTGTGPVTVTVNPAGIITLSPPPPATVGQPYQGPVGVTGGTPPYTCSVASGSLPPGLTLGTNCIITGTPTTPGTFTPILTATDSGNPPLTGTGPVPITVNPAAPLTFTGSLPDGTVGVPYSQTLHAAGGVAPYTYTLTAGTLPAGIMLSSSGVVSGTPTTPGASSFTVTATDSEATPQTAALPLVLVILYPAMPNDGELDGPYAFLFQGYDDVVAGVLAYQTATAGSFTADGMGGITAGELDANHQGSNPAGNTVSTMGVLGTYTIGADNRGLLTLTTLSPDGTVEGTTTYAISVKAPVSPATTSAAGSLIEYDDANLTGTRGSGTFLQQTSAASTTLSGSYTFGLSGDTPCLPACTAGVIAGPAASVGVFTTGTAGAISGTGDANIASTNIANSALSGSTTSADTNGRVQVSMTTSETLDGVYPQDYAMYVIDENRAFIISTDKHSAYILLAGSSQKQTLSSFADSSLTGAYVGYENSPTNPGLVGATLQNVLNLSTATIFRGTANGTGTCTTTNVDVGGTTGLVNELTGLGSGSNILNALLGTYQSTGNSACTVAASGRAVLNYPIPDPLLTSTLQLLGLPTTPPPARVVYLSSTNQGYFLETGYAGLGHIEQQTGSPFTVATLNGTFVYGTAPAASLASTNASGVFTADGAGHAMTTLDMNVGVGNINVLQLGVSGNFNYTLTDATAGRYLLGTSTVIYAITPGRFVLLDTSALSTSPSVALLY